MAAAKVVVDGRSLHSDQLFTPAAFAECQVMGGRNSKPSAACTVVRAVQAGRFHAELDEEQCCMMAGGHHGVLCICVAEGLEGTQPNSQLAVLLSEPGLQLVLLRVHALESIDQQVDRTPRLSWTHALLVQLHLFS